MLSKADGSQCAVQHHLKVEDLPICRAAHVPCRLRAALRARNEEEDGGGETPPCVLLQAEVHLVQPCCATPACLRHWSLEGFGRGFQPHGMQLSFI